nr:translation initiation factor IF-2-like [Oryctolagus cuniculus]
MASGGFAALAGPSSLSRWTVLEQSPRQCRGLCASLPPALWTPGLLGQQALPQLSSLPCPHQHAPACVGSCMGASISSRVWSRVPSPGPSMASATGAFHSRPAGPVAGCPCCFFLGCHWLFPPHCSVPVKLTAPGVPQPPPIEHFPHSRCCAGPGPQAQVQGLSFCRLPKAPTCLINPDLATGPAHRCHGWGLNPYLSHPLGPTWLTGLDADCRAVRFLSVPPPPRLGSALDVGAAASSRTGAPSSLVTCPGRLVPAPRRTPAGTGAASPPTPGVGAGPGRVRRAWGTAHAGSCGCAREGPRPRPSVPEGRPRPSAVPGPAGRATRRGRAQGRRPAASQASEPGPGRGRAALRGRPEARPGPRRPRGPRPATSPSPARPPRPPPRGQSGRWAGGGPGVAVVTGSSRRHSGAGPSASAGRGSGSGAVCG